MIRTHDDPIEEALDSYRAINRVLIKQIAPLWLKLDLSMAQVKTLWTVANNEPVTISQVSERLGVGLSTASHLVDKLVQVGRVERTEDRADRRRALVRLSPEGRDTLERLRQGSSEQFREWLSELDHEDLSALTQGLRALMQVISESGAAQSNGTQSRTNKVLAR